jgi:integrase
MAKRWLPKHVTMFTDRHGKPRFRYRRKGFEGGYFKSAFGTEDFRKELASFQSGQVDTVQQAIRNTIPGTIDDLVTRYFAVPSRLGPTAETQNKIRLILSKFRDAHGHRIVADVQFEHIEAIVEKAKAKQPVHKYNDDGSIRSTRMIGGVEAARKLRKELIRLFDFAIGIRMRPDNPVRIAAKVKVAAGQRSKGFHTWSEAEIAQFYERHPVGTKARMAMDLMLWTGQRRGDAIRFSKDHVIDGGIYVRQGKGGKELWIPIAPQLIRSIVAVPKVDGQKTYLVHSYGEPFKNASFGNWFRARCNEAGLPHCSAHGLRKAMMRRLAELHLGNQTLKSISGHTRDEEVATYTRDVNQARMAQHAIDLLSKWEAGENPSAIPLLEGL